MMTKRILNVGCWKNKYGTDYVDMKPQFQGVVKCNLDKDRLPYADNVFDEVYIYNVISHLTNLGHLLGETRRVLKQAGKLVIFTPNAGLWGWYGNAFHGGYEKNNSKFDRDSKDRVFSIFTPNNLRNWLTEYDFRIEELAYAMEDNNRKEIVRTPRILAGRMLIRALSLLSPRFMPLIKAVSAKSRKS